MILSPFLFTVYTSDFQYNSESYHLQQLPGDAAVVGVLGVATSRSTRQWWGFWWNYPWEITSPWMWVRLKRWWLTSGGEKKEKKKTVNDPINIIGEEVKQPILGCSFEYGCHVEEGMRRFGMRDEAQILQRVEQEMLEIFYQSTVACPFYFCCYLPSWWRASVPELPAGSTN